MEIKTQKELFALANLFVEAVFDERTPLVCKAAHGKATSGLDLPHDTGDPENLCRCVGRWKKCVAVFHLPDGELVSCYYQGDGSLPKSLAQPKPGYTMHTQTGTYRVLEVLPEETGPAWHVKGERIRS